MSNFYQYNPQQGGPYNPGLNNNAQYQQGAAANPGYVGNPGGAGHFPGEELLGNLKNPSPEVLQFGLNIGKQLIQNQSDQWLPGLSGFFLNLKYYFAVSNNYVLKKLLLILYPLSNKSWGRLSADDFNRSENDPNPTRKWALPKNDINAPDLYIPLMAFITYVLLYSFYKGIGSLSASTFSPDVISQAIWRCILLQVAEAGALKFGAKVISVQVPFLDCYSFAGYKYVALCLNTIARLIHGPLNILISLYTSCMLAYFIMKTTAIAVPSTPNESQASPRLIIVLGFGALQLLMSLFMSLV